MAGITENKQKALFSLWPLFCLRTKSDFISKFNMLSPQNEMSLINSPFISSKNLTLHFIGKKLRLTVASLTSMQFPKNADYNKSKLSVTAFLNNLFRYLK